MSSSGARPEVTINASHYLTPGLPGAQDNTKLNAAITNAGVGNSVKCYFPRGTYVLQYPFPSVSYVTYCGDTYGADTGRSCVLWADGVSMLTPNTTLYGLRFEDLRITAGTAGGNIIDFDAAGVAQNGIVFADFSRCFITTYGNPGVSALAGTVYNFFAIRFINCRIERDPAATVPCIDLKSTIGGLNHVIFEGGWIHSHGASSSPAVRIEGESSTAPIGDINMVDVIGEQNNGGLAHIGGANGARFFNVKDWDAVGTYADDIFRFYTPTGGAVPQGVVIENCGTSHEVTLASGKNHLTIQTGTGHRIGRIVNGASQAVLSVPAVGVRGRHGGGIFRSVRTITSSYVVTADDDILLVRGSGGITVTLPSPSALLDAGTVPIGRTWTVSNKSSGSVTIAPSSGAINDASTYSLAAGAAATAMTNGANWFTL